MLRLPF